MALLPLVGNPNQRPLIGTANRPSARNAPLTHLDSFAMVTCVPTMVSEVIFGAGLSRDWQASA